MPKLSEVRTRMPLEIKVEGDLQVEVTGCYISDLLSDVMAKSSDGDLWVTLQTHPNIVAVAVVKGLSGIIITNGRSPEPATAVKAEAEKITIMSCPLSTFEAAGRLYCMLNGIKQPEQS